MVHKKIMIVEDENIVALDLKHTLIRLGYEVASIVSSGEEAIKKVSESKPDLLLMDIMLKGLLNGVETAELIFNEYRIPVIFISAYPKEKTLANSNLKPYGYLSKPINEYKLFEAIEGNYLAS